ncbi:MAG: UDP-N-acetylmuramoyl-L-alanine--D-glutamate ligase [Gammaproteobacteria bacterium]|nr:MAG: UDP-N-acetylmuramoyl-L-alanine--D-glutamate ligase [Gammaproteobacteria bacterium]
MTPAAPKAPFSVVLGLGVTGLSCLRHLHAQGRRLVAMDSRDAPPEVDTVREELPDVVVITGGFDAAIALEASLIAVSPGIPADDPLLKSARSRGLDVAGDIELFARAAKAPIAAVTGTNGKSTVTSLLGAILLGADREVAVGGNLGTPALDLLPSRPADGFVLELSSFQLDLVDSMQAQCAAILNVSDDHLDRYGFMEAYARSKHRIFHGAKVAVFSGDDAWTAPPDDFSGLRVPVYSGPAPTADGWGIESGADDRRWLMGRGRPLLPVSDLPVAGRHNELNVLFALAMAAAFGVEPEDAFPAVRAFRPLPHRCTPAGCIGGVRFINDSKATNVGACRAAIDGLGEPRRNLVVIAGGLGKGADFQQLREPFSRCVKAAVLIGSDAPLLAAALDGICAIEHADTMDAAVARALAAAEPGDTVLLAPACASFDMFESYADRGERFVAAVQRLGGGAA